jgi:hypothetical protein
MAIAVSVCLLLPICVFFEGTNGGFAFQKAGGAEATEERGGSAQSEEIAPEVLEECVISKNANLFRFRFRLEENLEFIPLAPFRLVFETADPSAVAFEKKTYDKPALEFSFPISVENGPAMVNVRGSIYLCLSAEQGFCFFKRIDAKVPAAVKDEGQDVFSVDYRIEYNEKE